MKSIEMRTRRGRWLRALFLIAAGAAAVLFAMPRERLLLERATKAAKVDGWSGRFPREPAYHWLSDHEIVFFRSAFKGGGAPYYYPVRRDLRAGTETELGVAGLCAAYLADSMPALSEISPDGQWILLCSRDGRALLGRLDGSRHVSWEGGNAGMRWLRDSRHCVVFVRDAQSRIARAKIYGVDSPVPTQAFPFPGRSSLAPPGTASPEDAVQVNRHDQAVAFAWRFNGPGHAVTLYTTETPITPRATPAQRHTIHFAFQANMGEPVLSPQGDRIALMLDYTPKSPLRSLLGRWFPAYRHDGPPNTLGLWVSRLDGRDLHEVGHMDLPEIPLDRIPRGLRWLPDGRHLSFTCRGALYTVPAD